METKEKILHSALELFASKGYHPATTREIAERAGVNELTIFRHFGSKRGLLEDVLDFGFDIEGLRRTMKIEPTGDTDRDLEELIIHLTENFRKRERIYALLLREIGHNESVRRKLGELPLILKDIFLAELSKILEKDGGKCHDLETAGIFLASYFLRSEIMRILMGRDPFHEIDSSRIREVVRIFLHGYLDRGCEN